MASVQVLEVGAKAPAGSVELDPVIFEAPVRAHLFDSWRIAAPARTPPRIGRVCPVAA